MQVREILNISLDYIGVSQRGISATQTADIRRDLRLFQMVANTNQLDYPYDVTEIMTQEQLLTSGFSSVSSIIGYQGEVGGNSPVYTLTPISQHDYDELDFIPDAGGIPEYYLHKKDGTINLYPQKLSGYNFVIKGRKILGALFTCDTDLDPAPYMFQYYLALKTARLLCKPYKKSWDESMSIELEDVKLQLGKNSDTNYYILPKSGDNYVLTHRVRNQGK